MSKVDNVNTTPDPGAPITTNKWVKNNREIKELAASPIIIFGPQFLPQPDFII